MRRVQDLSVHNKVISAFIERTPSKSEWTKFRLNVGQLQQYKDFGFCPNVPVLTPNQVQSLISDCSRIINAVSIDNSSAASSWSPVTGPNILSQSDRHDILSLLHEYHSNETGDDSASLFHCLGHWRVTEAFHDLIFHPSIVVPVAQLLYIDSQRDYAAHNEDEYVDQISDFDEVCVRFWHDQLFCKPPGCGGNVAWHQDYSYWTRTMPMQHMTVHIALDQQTEDNGAIAYIPGSHEWYRRDPDSGQVLPLPITDLHFIDMDSIYNTLTAEEREQFNPQILTLSPGEAVFHHPLSVHGSYPNKSNKGRRAAVLNYFRDGTLSNTNEPLLFGMETVPKTQKLQTRFNPICYDPRWKMNENQLR